MGIGQKLTFYEGANLENLVKTLGMQGQEQTAKSTHL